MITASRTRFLDQCCQLVNDNDVSPLIHEFSSKAQYSGISMGENDLFM